MTNKRAEKPAPKAEEAPAPKVEAPAPVAEKPAETTNTSSEEPAQNDKIETVYQKLEGVKILKQTVDLSQFNKPKPQGGANSAAAKKKRKRIEKPNTPGSNTPGQGNNQGNRPQGHNR